MQLDLPTSQMLSVIILGFFTGALALHYFLKRPLAYFLIFGVLFFLFRLIPTISGFQPASSRVQEGGLVSEMIMWVVYVGAMLIGYFVIRAGFGKLGSTNESIKNHEE